jgi:hypothetical protein
MTQVAILPEPTDSGRLQYRAVAGKQQSVSTTPGGALDALTAALPPDETGTLVIVQHQRPDEYFTAPQQARLRELMARWRDARDAGVALPAADQEELDALVEEETRAAAARTASMLRQLGA